MKTTIQERRMWESTATHLEIRNDARRLGVATQRRFRVEVTAAGNSCLVTKFRAGQTKDRYGGKIVEIIPWEPIEVREAAKLPRCPFCKVSSGEPCLSAKKTIVHAHLARWNLFSFPEGQRLGSQP